MDSELFPMFGSYPFQSSAVSSTQCIFSVAVILTVAFVAQLCIVLYYSYRHCYASDDSRRRPPPARLHPSLFRFLPTFTYSSSTASDESGHPPSEYCAICLAEFEQGHSGRVLPNCNHIFHRRCIDRWFQSHSSCPLCRTLVDPPRISSQNRNTEEGQGKFDGFYKQCFPPWIGFSRKRLEMIELVEVIVPEEDRDRRQSFEGRSNLT